MNCINCGKETRKYTYRRSSDGGNKYCNRECHSEYWNKVRKKDILPVNCVICGNTFNPKSSINKYCSRKCKVYADSAKRSKKPITKKCNFCGNIFTPYTSLDKFCSANCRVDFVKSKRKRNWHKDNVERIVGEKNPAYRNGFYVRGNKKTADGERIFIKNSKSIKDNIIEQNGRMCCQHCGTFNSIKFESHHIVFRSEKPSHKNLHDKENIIVLCIECHNQFHKNKGNRNKIVKDRKLNSLFGNDVLNK